MSRIVLIASALRPRGSGVQRAIRELMARLPAFVESPLAALVPSDVVREVPDGIEAMALRGRGAILRNLGALRFRGEADLVHGLDGLLPARGKAPRVLSVYDLSLFDVPWTHPRRARAAKRRLADLSIRRADRIVTGSSFTAERIWHHFRREAEVIPLAPSTFFAPASEAEIAGVRERLRLPDRFVLHVGNLEPRRDLATLQEACRSAGLALVLVGRRRAGQRMPAARELGWRPDRELPALFGAATVVAYVSRYEGFGLPPLEALACEAPVMATRCGALPELAPRGIEFVPESDPEAQAGALRRLSSDPGLRQERLSRAKCELRKLNWASTARGTAAVYAELLGAAPCRPPAPPGGQSGQACDGGHGSEPAKHR